MTVSCVRIGVYSARVGPFSDIRSSSCCCLTFKGTSHAASRWRCKLPSVEQAFGRRTAQCRLGAQLRLWREALRRHVNPSSSTFQQGSFSSFCSAFDLARNLDDVMGLGFAGSAIIASEPTAAPLLKWWSEFSHHLSQTDSGATEPSDADIPTDSGDSTILDAFIHYLRCVHLVDFYTGKTGSSVLDLCRTVGACAPCRQPQPENPPTSAAVLSKAKALLHIHRQHLSALTASREFSQVEDTEDSTLCNFLQDWERLYPEVCIRAQPPPAPTAVVANTPSPRFFGRGVAGGPSFGGLSPQSHADFTSRAASSVMLGRSPRKLRVSFWLLPQVTLCALLSRRACSI
jgi:hypothetical protein